MSVLLGHGLISIIASSGLWLLWSNLRDEQVRLYKGSTLRSSQDVNLWQPPMSSAQISIIYFQLLIWIVFSLHALFWLALFLTAELT